MISAVRARCTACRPFRRRMRLCTGTEGCASLRGSRAALAHAARALIARENKVVRNTKRGREQTSLNTCGRRCFAQEARGVVYSKPCVRAGRKAAWENEAGARRLRQ